MLLNGYPNSLCITLKLFQIHSSKHVKGNEFLKYVNGCILKISLFVKSCFAERFDCKDYLKGTCIALATTAILTATKCFRGGAPIPIFLVSSSSVLSALFFCLKLLGLAASEPE